MRNKNIGPQIYLHKNVYSSVIHKIKNWKQTKCPLTGKQINIFLHIGILSNKNKTLLIQTTLMNLKNMRSKRACHKKGPYSMISFPWNPNTGKSHLWWWISDSGWKGRLTGRRHDGTLLWMQMTYILFVRWLHNCIQVLWTKLLRSVYFILC